ncbi:MAG: 2-hydroxyacyl-CoA dehydratase [Chloroflexota bacterium]|nr:MAG: 2-hydroxyacyl-CoA dehydratase [Chloroflexota bacterium]
MTEKTTARKATLTARKVRGIVKEMNLRAHRAKENGDPVAYCMVGSQYDEILHAMGITPIWTENYAGLCAAKRVAENYILRAESDGYSGVVCGYVRTGLGFERARQELGAIPEGAPDGGMARPDMMLGSSTACDPRFKWYQAAGKYIDVPTYAIDVVAPPVHCDLKDVEGYYVAYQLEQFKGLVEFLENQTRRKLDLDKLDGAFERAQQVYQVWWECDQLRRAVPGPMPSEDHFNVFVPALFRLCDDVTLDFYSELRAELRERVANGVGVIEDERYRLLWAGGLPPWHTMWIFNYFEDRGAVFVIERVYRGFDPVEIPKHITHPLEKLAYRTFQRMTQKYEQARRNTGNANAEFILEYIRDYQIDGMVMHATKSCRATTVGQLYTKNLIQSKIDIPFLQLQSDIIDLRDFSEEHWKSSIDAFLETAAYKKGSVGLF